MTQLTDQLTQEPMISEHERLAVELSRLTGNAGYRAIVEQYSAVFAVEIGQENKDRFIAMMHDIIPNDDLIMWQADLYEKHFSTEEIAAMLTFYRSDVWKRHQEIMPALAQASAERLVDIMKKRLPDALVRYGFVR